MLGHTNGHMCVKFNDPPSGQQLLAIGDAMMHPLCAFHPDWRALQDSIPPQATGEKKRNIVLLCFQGLYMILSNEQYKQMMVCFVLTKYCVATRIKILKSAVGGNIFIFGAHWPLASGNVGKFTNGTMYVPGKPQ